MFEVERVAVKKHKTISMAYMKLRVTRMFHLWNYRYLLTNLPRLFLVSSKWNPFYLNKTVKLYEINIKVLLEISFFNTIKNK